MGFKFNPLTGSLDIAGGGGGANTALSNLSNTDLQGQDLNDVGEISSTGVAAGGRPYGTLTDYAYSIEVNNDSTVTGVDPYIGFRRSADPGSVECWVGTYSGTMDIGANVVPTGAGLDIKVQAGASDDGNGGNLRLVGGTDNTYTNNGGSIILTPGDGATNGLVQVNGIMSMQGHLIQNVQTPQTGNDAATKDYVDSTAFPTLSKIPTKVVFFDDFFSAANIAVASGTAVVGDITDSLVSYGVLLVKTTGVATSAAYVPGRIRLTHGLTYQSQVRSSAVATALDNFVVRFGVGGTGSATPLGAADWTHGIYFEYDKDVFGGNLQFKTAAGGTRTTIDTGIVFNQVKSVKFIVNSNNTSVEAFITDVNNIETSVGTITTNLPGVNGLQFYYINDRLTSNASDERNLIIDYLYFDVVPFFGSRI